MQDLRKIFRYARPYRRDLFAAAVGRGEVKTPPYGAKDKRAVPARWRAGHARPLQTAPNGVPTRGAREGGSPPLPSWRVVDREWAATQCPSESPSHLTVTAPFDKGASLAPCGGSGERPNLRWRKARRR